MTHERHPSSIRRAIHQTWTLVGIIVVLIVTVLLVLGFGAKEISDAHHASARATELARAQQKQINCVASWANAYSARADRINKLNDALSRATDTLIRSIQSRDAAAFQRAFLAYIAASNDAANGKRADPLPPSPKFLCANLSAADLHLQPSATITVTQTPAPGPTTTRTRTTPGPTSTTTETVHVNGTVTRTHLVPGPTTTRTRTKTVTATKTVPAPCLIPILCPN